MKSLNVFALKVLNDIGTSCSLSTTNDQNTVVRRTENEGLSFFTITLPSFCRDFERCLDLGFVDPTLFQGFSRRKSGLPRFLGGFLDLVFSSEDGSILEEPSIAAIQAIRQFTLMFAKINIECTERRTRAAFEKYLQCENELDTRTHPDFIRMAILMFGDLFCDIDRKISQGQIVFKHSSGSTADHILGNRKYDHFVWTNRLDSVFPFYEGLLPNLSFYKETEVEFIEPGQELPVKVITVPKTLKTPRIIAMEPVYMQYVQQGILEALMQSMRQIDICRNLFLGDPDSQLANQWFARVGSALGSYATIDLSEASDRVSNQHVLDLLHYTPWISQAVQACRSTKADVDGRVITLSKFASMGSALCFPFEQMVFATVIFLGIQKELNRPLTRKDIKFFSSRVRVFGDDIVVPKEFVLAVVDELESYGFKINYAKSFWTGKFRESCGKEYYDGYPVNVTRMRHMFPTTIADVRAIEQAVDFRNRLDPSIFLESIKYIDGIVSKFLRHYPEVYPTSPIMGRHTLHPDLSGSRMCPSLQRPLVRGTIVKSRLPVSKLEGSGALMKFFLKRSQDPYEEEHLQRSGRAVSVNMKSGWFSVR